MLIVIEEWMLIISNFFLIIKEELKIKNNLELNF